MTDTGPDDRGDGYPSHVRCVSGGRNSTMCGRWATFQWRFVDVDHALRSLDQGERLVPCPRCFAVALKEQSERAEKAEALNKEMAPFIEILARRLSLSNIARAEEPAASDREVVPMSVSIGELRSAAALAAKLRGAAAPLPPAGATLPGDAQDR